MQDLTTFKYYYNAATKRFPRPERPDPMEWRETSHSVDASQRHTYPDQERSYYSADDSQMKYPTSPVNRNDTTDEGYKRINFAKQNPGRGDHENLSTFDGRGASTVSSYKKISLESFSAPISGSESNTHGLLPDVDEIHDSASSFRGLPKESPNVHAQRHEPHNYMAIERSNSEYRGNKRVLSSRPKQSTTDKSVQVELSTEMEQKHALLQTVGLLQDQLSKALALLREYSTTSASLRHIWNARAGPNEFYFSQDPNSVVRMDWQSEDGDRNASPVLATESETAKQLISLASDVSLPSSPKSPILFPDPPDRSPGRGPNRPGHPDDAGAPAGRDRLGDSEENHLKQRLQAMDDFVAAMMQENERLSHDLAAADGAVTALRAECATLHRAKLALEVERDSVSAERAAVERELAGLRAEAGKLIETLDGACRDRTSLAARLDDAMAELGRAASRLRGSRAERDALLERQVQMQVELDRFVRWHRRARREQSRLDALEVEGDLWRRVLRDLDEELRSLLRGVRQLLHSEAQWSEMGDEASQAKYWINRSHPAVVWITRGGGPRSLAATAVADDRLATAGPGTVGSSWDAQGADSGDDKRSGKGWGWPTASLFKRKVPTSRMPEKIQSSRDRGPVAAISAAESAQNAAESPELL